MRKLIFALIFSISSIAYADRPEITVGTVGNEPVDIVTFKVSRRRNETISLGTVGERSVATSVTTVTFRSRNSARITVGTVDNEAVNLVTFPSKREAP